MADFGNNAVFSEVDASNNSSTLPGIKGSDSPTRIDNAMQALMGALTRLWRWSNPTVTSTGSGAAYVLTYGVAPAALYNGQGFAWITHAANTGAATLNINSLGAIAIKRDIRGVLSDPVAGDILAGQEIKGYYNGTVYVWTNYRDPDFVVSGLTEETVIALDDAFPGRDTSAAADRKFQIQNIFKALNLFTEDATPDLGTDFLLSYDTSASAAKKVKPSSLVAAGALIKESNFQTSAFSSTTTLIPLDDTIPQNTEGAEFMSLAHTPSATTNILEIEVVAMVGSAAANSAIGALFKDSDANALKATTAGLASGGPPTPLAIKHWMAAGTVSAITFKFRAGMNAGTLSFNGASGARLLGGVAASSITIREYKA